jgi:ribonuclease HI
LARALHDHPNRGTSADQPRSASSPSPSSSAGCGLPALVVTDGACLSNGRAGSRGGWAALILNPTTLAECVLTGREAPTTNQRMEVTAVLQALHALPAGCDVRLLTDSTYVIWGLERCRRRSPSGHPYPFKANADLWQLVAVEAGRHRTIVAEHVRAHAAHPLNERANDLAAAQAAAIPAPLPGAQGARPPT